MRRPFIIRGCDYIETIKTEVEDLECDIKKGKYYVDEAGTTGDKY